jgi:hypothetical protein
MPFAISCYMKLTVVEAAQRSIPKFKHIQVSHIWAFVHGRGELDYEERNHLTRCDHCRSIFKYFAVCAQGAVEEPVDQDCAQPA